jgi:hypothetical protein
MIRFYILLFLTILLPAIAFSQQRNVINPNNSEGSSLFATNSGFTIFSESADNSDPYLKQQSINFKALPVKSYGDADFDPGAWSTAGLTISYSSSDSNVAIIENGKIHINGVGTTVITARQPGDKRYSAAKEVKQTLQVYYPRGLSEFVVSEFKVYPNPTNGPVVIKMDKYDGWWEVMIYEYGGRTMYYNPCAKTDQLVIDLSGKPKGLYFIKVICGNSMKIEKLILH